MPVRHAQKELIRHRLSREQGTLKKNQGLRVALLYPSPYPLAMSSLGYQTIYRIINLYTPHTAERAFLPDGRWEGPLLTYESLSPVGNMDLIAFSLAYELEAPGLIRCLELCGLAPLAQQRQSGEPPVILGGPITVANPLPFAPFVDAMVLGEAEGVVGSLLECVANYPERNRLLSHLAEIPGVYVPLLHQDRLPPPAPPVLADSGPLPAFSPIITPDSAFPSMHLVEAERGCSRSCTFCIMRRSAGAGMRLVSDDQILRTIPAHASRVGLVGAAVTDHPRLLPLVETIVESGREIGLSSLRADRITSDLVRLLGRGGNRTLTTALDGASRRLRQELCKGVEADEVIQAARLARDHGMSRLKLYVMVGVPGEQGSDIEELIGLLREIGQIIPLVASINPFVAKANTPLKDAAFAGIRTIDRRLRYLRKALEPEVTVKAISGRWGWVEYALAQGGMEMAPAMLEAAAEGGGFAAWSRAIARHAPRFMRWVAG
ncbi:MAG: radical SAM protein [Bradymonadales bacterium]|nr:radical SAM protein [Bradymonadales bacterium]